MLSKRLEHLSGIEQKKIQKRLHALSMFLQEKRRENGLSQEQFAEKLEVNVNSIKYIEQGRRVPSLAMLIRMCDALKIEIVLETESSDEVLGLDQLVL